MASVNHDRNLLYGTMALLLGFVSRDQLLAGLIGWVGARDKTLARILMDQGALDPGDDRAIVEAVARHLGRGPGPGGEPLDPAVSQTMQDVIREVDDPAIRESLAGHTDLGWPASAVVENETTLWASSKPGDLSFTMGGPVPTPPGDEQRFRILKKHAQGGLGEVYLAWDEEVGRNVALKVMKPEHMRNTRALIRFQREAEINGNLEHPGIVPVYSQGVGGDGRPYYAMRFVEGETFQAAIDRLHADRLDPGEQLDQIRNLLRRFLAICEAIDYAHSRGVLHRDLKPANILLGRFGEALIIDWGLAKVRDQPDPVGGEPDQAPNGRADFEPLEIRSSMGVDSTHATADGETLGTAAYMSPEQALSRHGELDERSDIYGLGATIYSLLTGRAPIRGRNTGEILSQVIRGAIEPPSRANPRVPKALDSLCMKALALAPADRYPTAQALADDLERWLNDQPIAVHRDSHLTKIRRWARKHRTTVIASAILTAVSLVGLSAAAAVAYWQRDRAIRARELAEDRLRIGTELVDKLVTLGDRLIVTDVSPRVRSDLLNQAYAFLMEYRKGEGRNLDLDTKVAILDWRIANLKRLTGSLDQADALYSDADAILAQLMGQELPGARLLARDQRAITLIDRSDERLLRGMIAESLADAEQAETLAAELNTPATTRPEYRRTLARALGRRGLAELAAGDTPAGPEAVKRGLDHLRQAIAILEPVADAALPDLVALLGKGRANALFDQLEVASWQVDLGIGVDQAGDREAAAGIVRRALERLEHIDRLLAGTEPPQIDLAHGLAYARARLASLTDDAELAGKAAEDYEAFLKRQPDFLPLQIEATEVQALLARLEPDPERRAQAAARAEHGRSQLGDRYPGLPALKSIAADLERGQPPAGAGRATGRAGREP